MNAIIDTPRPEGVEPSRLDRIREVLADYARAVYANRLRAEHHSQFIEDNDLESELEQWADREADLTLEEDAVWSQHIEALSAKVLAIALGREDVARG